MTTHTMDNPCGLDGFAFVEFAGPDAQALDQQFRQLGFQPTAQHLTQPITRYQQGQIEIILNHAPETQAAQHAKQHGPGASAMGFRVHDAQKAYDYVLKQGATAFHDPSHADHGLLAIEAIGGSVIYFVDAHHTPFQDQWQRITETPHPYPFDAGLCFIDHLTHNVYRGNMDRWAQFYERLFHFHEIRFFNIKGQLTGLISRALSSPCGKIKIPLNESKDDQSQIEEFLQDYHGEGIQHIAFSTDDIYHSVDKLQQQGVCFLNTPDTYYDTIQNRIPWQQEPLDALQRQRILIDGEKDPQHGLLLQIFTENIFGPVFFEIIQRKGNVGFGEGNFQALFEAIERDQLKRGTLKDPHE